ncbi:hypothetical protein [Cytobacillus oceanisediminis]|uniref:hypothetical protein n=1 Tax=Cytobacillus oceanisediminis TaxID=665099 RepID=UPI00203ADE50|nr:hypothetical protein [Cytobacillus oceanisediminis]MCM3393256.1 hypothetical protein [Cytobacillus oceanisediminis]
MIRKLIFPILLVLGISILLKTNFGSTENINSNQTVMYDLAENYPFFPSANSGTSSGLVYMDKSSIIEQKYFEFNHSSFSSVFSISNQNDHKVDYLVLFLVNFKQHDVVINHKTMKKFDLSLNSKEAAFIPFEIKGLKDGFNELTILLIPEPYTQNLEKEYRFSTDLSHVIPHRFNLIINNKNVPKIIYESFTTDAEEFDLLEGAFLSKSKELVPWLTERINGKENLEYKIHVGNNDLDYKNFALIALLDWEQTPINNELVQYGKIPSKSRVTIDSFINKEHLSSKGVSNFTVLYIPEPFKNINEIDFDSQILPTTRVGIDK